MNIAVLIGHGKGDSGGYDPGACAQGYQEFKLAREIGKYAADALSKYDHKVELVNYTGGMNLKERIGYCNVRDYSLVVECHLNAGKGTGCEVYHADGSVKGQQLAAAVSKGISTALGIVDRGARTKKTNEGTDYFGIIRQTIMHALLVETCFIDSGDVYTVNTEAGQRKAGEAMAKAIVNVLGIKEEAKMQGVLYIGDFTSKVEAQMVEAFTARGGHTCEVVPYNGRWGVLVTKLAVGKTTVQLKTALVDWAGMYSCDPAGKK